MALLVNPSTGKVLAHSGKALKGLTILSRVLASTGGDFSSVVESGEELHIGGYPDAILFELESGQETSAYYTWNGQTQQTGYNSIYDYPDLYDYEDSILRIYPASYDRASQDPSEESFIAAGVTPIFVLRLHGGYWEHIA